MIEEYFIRVENLLSTLQNEYIRTRVTKKTTAQWFKAFVRESVDIVVSSIPMLGTQIQWKKCKQYQNNTKNGNKMISVDMVSGREMSKHGD